MQLGPGCDIDDLQGAIHHKKGDTKFKLFTVEIVSPEIDFDRLPGTLKLSDFLDSNVDLRMEYKSASWASDVFNPPGEVTISSDILRKIIVPERGQTARSFFQEHYIKPDGGRFDLTTTSVSPRF